MSVPMNLFLILFCLAGEWFFSGIETGLVAMNRLRLQHLVRRKVPGAQILQGFLHNIDRLLGTTLVGTNICVTVSSTLAVRLGLRLFGPAGSLIASITMTLIILIFAEYFSKAWFQSFPATRSLPFAHMLQYARYALSPISIPLMFLVRHLVPAPKTAGTQPSPMVTREEIVHLAGEGKHSGILTPAEHKMIHEVIQLQSKSCREIMTPRDKIVYVKAQTPASELVELARSKVFNRFPVYDEEKKKYIGIVHMFDVLADPESKRKSVADYMRTPQFIGDYTPVDHILPRMRVTRQPMVLVTNDRFEVIGLITQEDVLDEVVGRI